MLKRILSLLCILGLLSALPAMSFGKDSNPKVLIKTTKGDITVELYPEKAPLSVQNFLSYVDEKFYDGTIFHRVIKGFMIQAGGLSTDLIEKQGKPSIKNERNDRHGADEYHTQHHQPFLHQPREQSRPGSQE